MADVQFANNALSTLASGITDADLSLDVAAGEGALFPTLAGSQYFYLALINSSNQYEYVKVTARATDTLTIERAQEGTAARAFSAGDRVELRLTAGGLADFAVDYAGLMQTPSEKTIASGEITVSNSSPWLIHDVDTEGDAASDDLTKINGGAVGSILVLMLENASRHVTVKVGSDIIMVADFTLNSVNDRIMLQCKSTDVWVELSRASNG